MVFPNPRFLAIYIYISWRSPQACLWWHRIKETVLQDFGPSLTVYGLPCKRRNPLRIYFMCLYIYKVAQVGFIDWQYNIRVQQINDTILSRSFSMHLQIFFVCMKFYCIKRVYIFYSTVFVEIFWDMVKWAESAHPYVGGFCRKQYLAVYYVCYSVQYCNVKHPVFRVFVIFSF